MSGGELKGDTLDFFGWLRLSLSVSDGHWKERRDDRSPDRRFSSHLTRGQRPTFDRPREDGRRSISSGKASVIFFNILSNKKLFENSYLLNFDARLPVLNLNVVL